MRRTEHLLLLGLDESATADEIRAAYLRLAKELHPDVNAAPEALGAFFAITEAYRALNPTPASMPPSDKPPTVYQARPPAPSSSTARKRWAGATVFSISVIGALLAANAAFRPAEREWRLDDDRALRATTTPPPVRDKGAMPPAALPPAALPPAALEPAHVNPAASEPAASTPPILIGRSARGKARAAPPTVPAALPPQVARVGPTQQMQATPPQAKPIRSLQTAPVQVRPNLGWQTMRGRSIPMRAVPFSGQAAPSTRGAKARPQERARQAQSEPARNTAGAAKRQPAPTLQPPTVENLAGSSLKLLRSMLE